MSLVNRWMVMPLAKSMGKDSKVEPTIARHPAQSVRVFWKEQQIDVLSGAWRAVNCQGYPAAEA